MSQPATDLSTSIEPLLYREDFDSITRITLNRPQKYNPLSRDMLAQLQSTFDEIASDESVRVIILAAKGKAFSAGHDLHEMLNHSDSDFAETLLAECSRMMVTINQLPQPVIAQVQGIATAGGCHLVANCDLAIASTESKFAVSGINLGLFCSTPGVALSRNVSRKTALEMLLTGDFIDAQTALEKGLVNRLAKPEELEDAALDFAQSIAVKPREVIALGKRLFYDQIDQQLEDAYKVASECMVCNLGFPSAAEGISAFIEKRKPDWS
ncbi:MAG: enoyl-CoA hydratase [Gammaproteobacteria bacterium]|nr:enoyl-CoA hydratase [Gammaproteobacteria bacterium]